VLTQGPQVISTWQKGWIQIVGSVGPTFPSVDDIRRNHINGCMHSGACGATESGWDMDSWDANDLENCAMTSCCCPRGAPLWSSTTFFVSKGDGGALASSGQNNILITDSVFRENAAPNGASLSVRSAASIRITNTTFDEPTADTSSIGQFVAISVDACAQYPCTVG
jgi:hypothetical protein